jgi:hypothetical protein
LQIEFCDRILMGIFRAPEKPPVQGVPVYGGGTGPERPEEVSEGGVAEAGVFDEWLSLRFHDEGTRLGPRGRF